MLKIKDCRKFIKKCKSCGKLKLITDFSKHGRMKDEYMNQCKVCNYNKAKSRHLLVCLECGKEFTSQKKERKFCSLECKNNHNREEVLCEYCKKPIKLKKAELKNVITIFVVMSVVVNGIQTTVKKFCAIIVGNL